MSTRMRDEDWDLLLEVFRACLPRRGAKGQDDRLFGMVPLAKMEHRAS